jgi:hypothetical protein
MFASLGKTGGTSSLTRPSKSPKPTTGMIMAASPPGTMGNPAVHEVLTASAEDRGPMKEWLSEGCDIPFTAHHLVVRRCFYTAQQGESFQANPVEVTLLQQGGAVLDNHEVCYFPAFKVASWIDKYCVARQRRKHLLSCLAEAQASYSQQVYDYSPGQSK